MSDRPSIPVIQQLALLENKNWFKDKNINLIFQLANSEDTLPELLRRIILLGTSAWRLRFGISSHMEICVAAALRNPNTKSLILHKAIERTRNKNRYLHYIAIYEYCKRNGTITTISYP